MEHARRRLCLWLPRLSAERLLRRLGRPDAPFATVAEAGGARRLASVCPTAEAAGLRPGMGLTDARAVVPDLVTRPADPPAEALFLDALARWAQRWTPWAATDGADGLALDVTGCAHLFGGEAAMAAEMVARLAEQGLTARAAVADTRGAAWALARFRPGPGAGGPDGDAIAVDAPATRVRTPPRPRWSRDPDADADPTPADPPAAASAPGAARMRDEPAAPRAGAAPRGASAPGRSRGPADPASAGPARPGWAPPPAAAPDPGDACSPADPILANPIPAGAASAGRDPAPAAARAAGAARSPDDPAAPRGGPAVCGASVPGGLRAPADPPAAAPASAAVRSSADPAAPRGGAAAAGARAGAAPADMGARRAGAVAAGRPGSIRPAGGAVGVGPRAPCAPSSAGPTGPGPAGDPGASSAPAGARAAGAGAAARARGPGAQAVVIAAPGRTRAALAALPVAALRLAPDAAEALARLGLRRIGDLALLPRGAVARRFGIETVRRLDQAMGAEPEPLAVARPAPPLSARLTLPEPIGRLEDVAAGLDRLLAQVCARLAEQGLGARRLRLTLRRVDGADLALAIGLARPSRDPATMAALFQRPLAGADAGYGIDALRLQALDAEPLSAVQHRGRLAAEAEAAARADPGAAEALALLLGRLGNRLGFERLTRLLPADSHIPARAFTVAAAAWSEPHAGPWPAAPGPRPLTLHPPEPAEVEVADLPVGPARPPRVLRWRGRRHALAAAFGPERIAPEWWLDDPDWRDGPRDYWRVETAGGLRLWLFHTPGSARLSRWFVEGAFA